MNTQDNYSGSYQAQPDGATRAFETQAKDKAGEVVEQAKDKAGEVVDQAKETAGEVVDKVRQQASSRLDTQKERAVGTLERFELAILQAGTQLREQDQVGAADLTDKAAEQIDRVSTYLRNRDLRDIVVEAERFARRQPMLFLGAAFTLGLLGARFMKSSGQSMQGSSDYSRGYSGGSSGGYLSAGYSTAGSSPSYVGTAPDDGLQASQDYSADYSESSSWTKETETTEGSQTSGGGKSKKKSRKDQDEGGENQEGS